MVRTVQFQAIDLRGRVTDGASIEFLFVEVPTWPFRASLGSVRYKLNGEEQPYGLRLDMDKRVFLDHFEDDAEKERVLAAAAPQIIEVVHKTASGDASQPPPAQEREAAAAAAVEPGEREFDFGMFQSKVPFWQEAQPQVFISCSYRDIEWGNKFRSSLKDHLGRRTHAGRISLWDDSPVGRGDKWLAQCRQELETSKVIILLVSENFLSSEFGVGHEFQTMLKEASKAGAVIVPVMIEQLPRHLTGWMKELRVAAPTLPLKYLPEREQERVVEGVTEIVQESLET